LFRHYYFSLFAFSLVSFTGKGQHVFWSDTSKNIRRITVPIFIISPETHIAAGALGVLLWKNIDLTRPTRTSNAELITLYTSRQQLIFIPRYTIFTKGEKFFIEGFGEELIGYKDFYFGRGNNTPVSNREDITYNVIGWENKIGRKILKNQKLFMGIETRALTYYNLNTPLTGELLNEKITGYKGSVSVGLGPALIWDTRDNVVNPSKGFYWDFRYSQYSTALGGTVGYHRTYLDFRKYINVIPKYRHIIAMELFADFVRGNAPFKELAELGGPRIMRGYYRGRFRDNYLTAFQTEYRMPVYKRLGVVAFAGLGKVYNPTTVNLDDLHLSYGGGIRYQINKREKLNIRIDYARGDPKYLGYFYFGLTESF